MSNQLGALEGVRVVDMATMMAGPTTAMLLGDMGASVIKVESPAGDDLRYMNSHYAPEAAPFFLAVNRNKRGIVLDIRMPAGLAVLKTLLADADVFTHNLRPGVAERLGIAFDDLKEANPRLVYCSISAWGERGPWASRPGIDSLVQAMAGLMSVTGEAEGRFLRAGVPLIDMTTPLAATIGIMAALTNRERTGLGDKVEASLLSQALFMQGPMFSYSASIGQNPPRMGNRSPMAIILEAQTDTGGMLIGIPTQKFWVRFCESVGHQELVQRPEFRTHELRLKNQAELAAQVEPRLLDETREYWLERLVQDGVPCAPVNDYQEARHHEQVIAIEAFLEIEQPDGEALIVPNVPWRVGDSHTEIRYSPPTLGRDTEEVLREHGYEDAQIQELYEYGVTRGAFVKPE